MADVALADVRLFVPCLGPCQAFDDGRISVAATEHGQFLEVFGKPGFAILGAAVAKCDNGRFTLPDVVGKLCRLHGSFSGGVAGADSCPALFIGNSKFVNCSGPQLSGSSCAFECATGYFPSSGRVAKCFNGTWEKDPACKRERFCLRVGPR